VVFIKLKLKVRSGFSLVEVLLSMLLIAFSIFGLVALQVSMIRNARLNHNQIVALYFAESRLEVIRIEGAAVGILKFEGSNAQTQFEIISSVTRHEYIQGLKHVEVRVSWTDAIDKTHHIILHSAIADKMAIF